MKSATLRLYVWLMAVFFGAVLSETVILYPNIFHDVPDSLPAAMKFLKIVGPHDFFSVLGSLLILTGIVANAANWSNKEYRPYLVSSFLLLFLFEFIFSVFYFWPRNTIMFIEGTAKHTPAELRRVASEFQQGHWVRLAVSLAASVLAFQSLRHFQKKHISSNT